MIYSIWLPLQEFISHRNTNLKLILLIWNRKKKWTESLLDQSNFSTLSSCCCINECVTYMAWDAGFIPLHTYNSYKQSPHRHRIDTWWNLLSNAVATITRNRNQLLRKRLSALVILGFVDETSWEWFSDFWQPFNLYGHQFQLALQERMC